MQKKSSSIQQERLYNTSKKISKNATIHFRYLRQILKQFSIFSAIAILLDLDKNIALYLCVLTSIHSHLGKI